MKSNMRTVHNSTVAAIAFALASAAPVSLAEEEIPFDESELFFELNNTDGDLGIHALIDGEGWKKLEIEDPKEHIMLKVSVERQLKKQGLTEFFFESAEPTFDELDPEEFFERFPEGEYEIEGTTLDDMELESEVELTHLMPAPASPTVNGAPKAEKCDDEEPGFDATQTSAPVTIAWPAVTMSHPDLGRTDELIDVVNYEVVVEIDDTPYKTSTILPNDVTSLTIPAEFIALGEGTFKYEILVREESYNQTAVESCFEIE